MHTALYKVTIKYVGLVVIHKIIDPHNYLLMTLDDKILRGLYEHETKTHKHKNKSRECSQFSAVKTDYEYWFKISLECKAQLTVYLKSTNI